MDDDVHVLRVLRASTHFEVLELPEPTPASALVDRLTVRSRYKSLAVRVHPDKNRSPDAEEAFKRLSVAYDSLSVESAQREYVAELWRTRSRSQAGGAASSSAASQRHARQRHKRKRTHKAATSSNVSGTPPPSRERTPEEIWRQFQREEEELARREFMTKGFERVYSQPKSRGLPPKPSSPSTSPSLEQEEVLATDLDTKATQWTTWMSRPAKARKVETQPVLSPPHPEAPIAPHEPIPVVCCFLCRRKFASHEQLSRHEAQSALHAANVAKALAGRQRR